MQVREYAVLTTDTTIKPSLDVGIISEATFNWLLELDQQNKRQSRVFIIENRKMLKLGSYVGFLQSPFGESIEILPKTELGVEDPLLARRTLQNMLRSSHKLVAREYGQAELKHANLPIHEWIFSQFLKELKSLVARGLRFDYQRIDEESVFIRGQLNISAQQRQPPGKANCFHIRHDVFTPDRIENRLLKTALMYIQGLCKHPDNWRLANELAHQLDEIQPVINPLSALPQWKHSKLMQTYESIRPWCSLILEKINPAFQKDSRNGIALLFRMEMLFEQHVANYLEKSLLNDWKLKTQASSEYLVRHRIADTGNQQNWFQLKPDILLISKTLRQVLDTKWKLLDESANTSEDKYAIQQPDLYQMFAYGQKYQNGYGHMMLIYPKHDRFKKPLLPFLYSDQLTLWIVPFCIETNVLLEGDWIEFFPALNPKKLLLRVI